MLKLVTGFAPAQIIPGLASFLAVYAFTRLTSPAVYGVYALAIALVLLLQSTLFQWVQVSAMRFSRPGQVTDPLRDAKVEGAIYQSWCLMALAFVAVYLPVIAALRFHSLGRDALLMLLPMVLLRSLVSVQQAFNRSRLRVLRFNLVETGQAIGTVVLGVALIGVFRDPVIGLLAGATLSSLLVALPGLGRVARLSSGLLDLRRIRDYLRYGAPLTGAYALNFVLSSVDRFLIEHILGADAVGVYSVAYSLVDRSLASIFIAINFAAFPLAVKAIETGGVPAARAQLRRNGGMLAMVAIPSCVGIATLAGPLASVLIGPEFRDGAVPLMAPIALGALLAGFQVHYFDHAFHLSRKTTGLLWSLLPCAVFNVLANLWALPRFGLDGAAWVTVATYALGVLLSARIGRRVLTVPLPIGAIGGSLLASAAMWAALVWADPDRGALELAAAIAFGIATYWAIQLLLNIRNARAWLASRRAGRLA
ncbi:polysaccharide biosynthesis C-terminal domain-containing protein [Derxia gummosa]|uniref:Polysaccharide biosynthesis C-terminal domain-containing protein n=1 Tax=Derxia gummosa DSM 723 TaxID=1121388 RepID=A0A8B6X3S7_9BURK|nr:oligosaccharide flippase family protein [Derxia gummosa]